MWTDEQLQPRSRRLIQHALGDAVSDEDPRKVFAIQLPPLRIQVHVLAGAMQRVFVTDDSIEKTRLPAEVCLVRLPDPLRTDRLELAEDRTEGPRLQSGGR